MVNDRERIRMRYVRFEINRKNVAACMYMIYIRRTFPTTEWEFSRERRNGWRERVANDAATNLRERQSLVGGVGSIVEREREGEGEPKSKGGRGGEKTEELSSLLVRESNPRTINDP